MKPSHDEQQSNTSHDLQRDGQKGAVGWILLWVIGIPIPILLVLWLLRGGT